MFREKIVEKNQLIMCSGDIRTSKITINKFTAISYIYTLALIYVIFDVY